MGRETMTNETEPDWRAVLTTPTDTDASLCPTDQQPCALKCNSGPMSRQCDPVRPKGEPVSETQQIVAWIRSGVMLAKTGYDIANAIERGDHLK